MLADKLTIVLGKCWAFCIISVCLSVCLSARCRYHVFPVHIFLQFHSIPFISCSRRLRNGDLTQIHAPFRLCCITTRSNLVLCWISVYICFSSILSIPFRFSFLNFPNFRWSISSQFKYKWPHVGPISDAKPGLDFLDCPRLSVW